jgi:CCR4-NOT transcription complex subunit 6
MDGRLAALTAACLGITLAWLRGRSQERRRQGARGGRPAARLVPRSRPLVSRPGQLSLVSYNCLCQKYANPRRLPHVFAQFLDPDYRWGRLQAELAAFGSDVVALQEVTVDRWGQGAGQPSSLGCAGNAATAER